MGHVELAGVGYDLPDGRPLLTDVSCRVGDGVHAVLVGPNGAGKTTLLRLVTGELTPTTGTRTHSGSLGVMPQFIGSVRDDSDVTDLLLRVSPPRLRTAGEALAAAEAAMIEAEDESTQLGYAQALADWADAGGYDAEVFWDTCTRPALGIGFEQCRYRPVRSLSGGEQKRLVLHALLDGGDDVLLLDEPDNYLDVPAKRWLEDRIVASPKTVLVVSHDRELLARVGQRVVALELGRGGTGNSVWVHGGGFASWHDAREERFARLEELRRRWDEDRAKLRELVLMYRQKASYNSDMAARYRAAQTRLDRFDAAGPPQAVPRRQRVRMRLTGARTGVRALTCRRLELTGLMRPFDLEVFHGDRVAVLGSNGSGKSSLLRLLADPGSVAHTGEVALGARVVPGLFAQTHDAAGLDGRTLLDILWTEHSQRLDDAAPSLDRYELAHARDQRFETLSGGQQARMQILLLELSGVTLLLLDEPTDNLDLASADALQEGLRGYAGTVLAVTHDRWFARDLDRFLLFGADGAVTETDGPVWDETRVRRARA